MAGLVLDTSALYMGKDLPEEHELVVSPGVVRELEREGMSARLELLLATKIRVLTPSKDSLDRVAKEAQGTGDSARLSPTDIEVLALAADLGYEIVTDDYSIQNLAAVLKIPCRGLDQRGITRVIHWDARCGGCGKTLPADADECDVCGGKPRLRGRRGKAHSKLK